MSAKFSRYAIYEFGDFRLDSSQLMLYGRGEELSLPPKAVETLLALIERRGQIVSKDELMEAIWSDAIVEESNLSRYIHILRTSLGHQADGRPYIETFRRRGYRLNAEVSRAPADNGPTRVSVSDFQPVRTAGSGIREGTTGNVIALTKWARESVEIDSSEPEIKPLIETSENTESVQFGLSRAKNLFALSAILVLAIGITAAAYFGFRRTSPVLTDKDVILIADFENKTGEEVFDGTLKKGIEIQLQQSPYLNIFADESTQETLKLMQRPPVERISREIAGEICQRRGLKAYIVGTIAPVGSHYALTLQAINGQTGEAIASAIEEADSKEKVLAALSRAATGLRERLGESLQSIAKLDSPIELTTSSLEALKLHYLGRKAMLYPYDFPQAIAYFKRAIEVDPNFAYAYIELAVVYENIQRFELSVENINKAYGLRDHVSELERLLITDSYYSNTFEIEKRREVLVLLRNLYPRDSRVLLRLAKVYEFLGEYEKAIEVASDSLDENPKSLRQLVIIHSLMALNRFAEARMAAEEALDAGYDPPDVHRLFAEIAFATNDDQMLQRSLKTISEGPQKRIVFATQARIAIRSGRYKEANELFKKAIETPDGKSNNYWSGFNYGELATYGALFGRCGNVQNAVAKALSAQDSTSISSSSELGLAFCGEPSLVEPLISKRLRNYPEATVLNKVHAPIVRAALRITSFNPERALEILRSVPEELSAARLPYNLPYLRGTAYLNLGRGPDAAKEFQRIIDSPGESVFSPLYPLAYVGLARSQVLTGDFENARQNYQKFFEIWKDADTDLPPLIEARKEYSKLQKQYGWES